MERRIRRTRSIWFAFWMGIATASAVFAIGFLMVLQRTKPIVQPNEAKSTPTVLGEQDGLVLVLDDEGKRLLDTNGLPASGKWTERNIDGSPWFEMEFQDGRQHGTETHWFDARSHYFKRITPYANGKKHGIEVILHRDGTREEIAFEDGMYVGE